MPGAIDTQTKKQVIKQWLSGDSRDRIAVDNDIGAGTVSNIINEWKKGFEDSDFESIRELAVFSKKQGLNLIEQTLGRKNRAVMASIKITKPRDWRGPDIILKQALGEARPCADYNIAINHQYPSILDNISLNMLSEMYTMNDQEEGEGTTTYLIFL
jgi:hypothetical protein